MTSNLERRLAEFDAAIAATTDEHQRAMIRNFRDHNEYEQTGNVDGMCALYTDDAEFHIYGGVIGAAPERHHKGQAEIRARYEGLREVVAQAGDPESHLDHLLVGDQGISGIMSGVHVAPGRLLQQSGFEVDDPDATYEQRQRIAFFRDFRDGLACSMTYFTSAPVITKVSEPA